MERIRPPYRPDDDIPFKAWGWRLMALVLSVLAILFVAAGLALGGRISLRGWGPLLRPSMLLFFGALLPLIILIYHYLGRRK